MLVRDLDTQESNLYGIVLHAYICIENIVLHAYFCIENPSLKYMTTKVPTLSCMHKKS
uniref:Uncharacterized protein n=1 Tax=Arundo donax TaxID=35708 RepID=A0A0A9HCJ7_ARUDO